MSKGDIAWGVFMSVAVVATIAAMFWQNGYRSAVEDISNQRQAAWCHTHLARASASDSLRYIRVARCSLADSSRGGS
jgi:hypothetical protein